MESNEPEKKPKRPRIGQVPRATGDNSDFSRYEKVNYGKPATQTDGDGDSTPRYQRPYAPRQGGYNNNRQGGYYSNNGGYNNRQNGGYQQRPRPDYAQSQDAATTASAEGTEGEVTQTPSYQPRYNNNYNRQGGYNNQNRQGGYNNNRLRR